MSDERGRQVRVSVLGPASIAGCGELQRRDRTVLGVLLLRRGHYVRMDEIAFAIWGDNPPASYRKVVQGSIVRLRRALGAGLVRTVADGYQIGVGESLLVDVDDFERGVEAARADLGSGRAARAAERAKAALALWRGTAFVDLEEWPPAEAERMRLESARDSAVDIMLEGMLQAGHGCGGGRRCTTICCGEPLSRTEVVDLGQSAVREWTPRGGARRPWTSARDSS